MQHVWKQELEKKKKSQDITPHREGMQESTNPWNQNKKKKVVRKEVAGTSLESDYSDAWGSWINLHGNYMWPWCEGQAKWKMEEYTHGGNDTEKSCVEFLFIQLRHRQANHSTV